MTLEDLQDAESKHLLNVATSHGVKTLDMTVQSTCGNDELSEKISEVIRLMRKVSSSSLRCRKRGMENQSSGATELKSSSSRSSKLGPFADL